MLNDIQKRIMELKKERVVCILALCYQPLDILEVADFVGDSFGLAQKAAKAPNAAVMMCGVRFMAETVKILSPEKRVLIPREEAGCPMAEQLDVSRQSVSKWELNDAAPEISKIIALSELFGISTDELLKGAGSIPAAAEEKESIAAIARLNAAEKRIRTGFITAVAGLIMLALELLLLPVMQVMEHNAFGHFLTNAMDYAGKMPMKAVIFITAAAIAAGGIFMYQGYLCKRKQ